MWWRVTMGWHHFLEEPGGKRLRGGGTGQGFVHGKYPGFRLVTLGGGNSLVVHLNGQA